MSTHPFTYWPPSATFYEPNDQPNRQPEYPPPPLSEHTTGLPHKHPFLQSWPSSSTLREPDQTNSLAYNPTMPLSRQNADKDAEGITQISGSGPIVQDILSVVAILVMLAWPWAFFGAVWAKGGVRMSDHIAKVVLNDPHATTYFITLTCSVISMITGALFSLAIMRLAQELVTHHKLTQPFYLRVLLAFQYQTWPWGKGVKAAKYLMKKDRWWPTVLVIMCLLTFPHLISSTTSLITPVSFNRTADLTGTELDFSSNASDCLAWFAENPLSNNCSWHLYKGLQYTSCLGESQMVDVLESGRGNILELVSNNTQSLTFSQLGGEGGLHFLGPIRGVLPIGPNGVPAFDTLEPSPFSNPKIMAGMTSYDYTLNHQGLTSNVSCSYAPTYPFVIDTLDGTFHKVLVYNASCTKLGEIEVLTDVLSIPSTNSYSFLAYWACQSAPDGTPADSYSIYLAGLHDYESRFGNITCTVDPIQTAIYPVTYHSTANVFTPANPTPESFPITFPDLMTHALVGLGDIISEGQNSQGNLVADSVITFAAKSFDLQPNEESNPQLYLWLFEQMIQGIIEYEATYLRLIYSTVPNPPPSCIRKVTGSLEYQVLGWFVTGANIGFMIPMTIINVAALVAVSIAMRMARTGGYIFHRFPSSTVTHAEQIDQQEQVPNEVKLLGEHFFENVQRKSVHADEHHPDKLLNPWVSRRV